MDISGVSEYAMSVIETYGWYILFAFLTGIYIYNTYLKQRINDYLKRRSDQEYSAKYHKNSDLLEKRLRAQQTYVQKLQEKYNQEADDYLKKMEEREVQKREELAQKLEGKGGSKLGSFKPEYNPLMGAGSSSGYRPPKKSCCKKGGCG